MPANLPPQYIETERKLKSAATPEEKIAIMEELLSMIPKHKGTEKMQAQLKTKMAKLKNIAQKKSSTARHGSSHKVKKSGAGQVVVLGPPNAGKSLLVKSLTNTEPQVGDYPFTTLVPYAAMMKYENVQVQLVDTPPVTPDYMEIWYPDMVKAADRVLIIMDLAAPDSLDMYLSLLDRLRSKKVEFIGEDREPPGESGRWYKKSLLIANKIDHPRAAENFKTLNEILESDVELIPVSALTGEGLEDLKKRIYLLLGVIRVYSKVPGKKAEYDSPFTLEKGSDVMDMAKVVHKDFAQKLKFARIWSKNKYDGQRVNRSYLLEDEDIIELHM